ncbi:MAG: membrane protein insertion efficiency factor YidD [candidate division Zixibacteria bacterium]|nr:membrane protein insertion efficiency factor YidD [candidate division Zixibacteria bacterium]
MAWLFLGCIKLYRLFLSPLMSMFAQCRFYPTCSQYGLDAISKYGAFKGGWMTIKRVLRCNPLFPGGCDPVE